MVTPQDKELGTWGSKYVSPPQAELLARGSWHLLRAEG